MMAAKKDTGSVQLISNHMISGEAKRIYSDFTVKYELISYHSTMKDVRRSLRKKVY